MTVEYFVSPLSRFSEWKTGKITEGALIGYTYTYRDIIIEPDKILPKGALIYVKDRGADDEPWHLARYDRYTDELYAHLVEDSSCGGDWRYALIPADIITDVAKMPSAEELITTMLLK